MLLSMAPLCLLGHNEQNEMKQLFVHMMPVASVLESHGDNGIENDILFLRSRQL